MMAGSSDSRCLASLTVGGEDIKYGPQTSYYSVCHSGTSQMTAVVQCRSSPLTGIAVVSGINPAPTNYGSGGYSTFSGYHLASMESAVGFTVELSSDRPLFPGSRIRFDNVITNFGGMYDAEHGYFECPDSSIYSFTVTTHFPEYDNQWSVSKLVFGGETILHGPITFWATEDTDSGSSSVTVVLQCQQGKDIYVEAKEAYIFPNNVYGAGLTSFAGARLCSTDCDDYVAFSAVLTHNVTSSGLVIFDHILINQGNAYNPSDGKFTCPDNKLYFFTWSGTMIEGNSRLELFFNSSRIRRAYTQFYTSSADSRGTSGTSSQTAIIKCSIGISAYLSHTPPRFLLAEYSVFSGYLIPNQ